MYILRENTISLEAACIEGYPFVHLVSCWEQESVSYYSLPVHPELRFATTTQQYTSSWKWIRYFGEVPSTWGPQVLPKDFSTSFLFTLSHTKASLITTSMWVASSILALLVFTSHDPPYFGPLLALSSVAASLFLITQSFLVSIKWFSS